MPTSTALQPCRPDPSHDGARSLPQPVLAGALAPAAAAGPQACSPYATAPGSLPCWPSQALLGRGVEALIRHGDALYRLRLTRQGKLILTK